MPKNESIKAEFIDVAFTVGPTQESKDGDGETEVEDPIIFDEMAEIGRLVLKHGQYRENNDTVLATRHDTTINIPQGDNTHRIATVSFCADTHWFYHNINVSVEGPSPQGYRKTSATRASVMFYNDSGALGPKETLSIYVNKAFFPEAKDFEEPRGPQTDDEKSWERHSRRVGYKNTDGVDMVHVSGPLHRLGPKTLDFAERFIHASLAEVRDYSASAPETDWSPIITSLTATGAEKAA